MQQAVEKSCVVLIGMPGAGKSTLGVMLAKTLAKDFVDTDLLIQNRAGKTLQSILDEEGYLVLRQLEAETLLSHQFHNQVVATGGSAVYSEAAMEHLARTGVLVYLQVPIGELRRRITDYETRGIAALPGQPFADLFAERQRLYQRFADITVDVGDCSQQEALQRVLAELQARA
ncbi:shikimate kinase [Pseudomaricurvus sp. HS19]|uniref:shikimate kinase n=1 Tax=Pseudomaricurvus sp. HS19 TaxID=2692626 RepID=UPI00136F3FDF|nr:shikimate kinase [Pseudomaricurvus sp. HS19]MYM63078.1 shikimate kinase [Pseudomaricurvus sp. HS19]